MVTETQKSRSASLHKLILGTDRKTFSQFTNVVIRIRFYKKIKINKYIFLMKMTPLLHFIHLIMQEYDSKCLKMYLITLKVFKICLRRSPKSMKGSQIHLAHWKWHIPRVEKLSKALENTTGSLFGGLKWIFWFSGFDDWNSAHLANAEFRVTELNICFPAYSVPMSKFSLSKVHTGRGQDWLMLKF
jgi:hypothetical protein